jgi:putative ABC transport system permease protein
MIALVLAMVWTRRGQAATLALLSLFGVAAAVAAPAYLRAADRAVAAGQVATAATAERDVEIVNRLPDVREEAGGAVEGGFQASGSGLLDLPRFTYVYAAEFATVGLEPDDRYRTRLVYRQRACEHLSVTAGRCLIGESDVVIGERTARRLGVAPGDAVTLSFAVRGTKPGEERYLPNGRPKRLLVAGLYRVPDPDDAYWGAHDYFAGDAGNRPGEPAFVNAATVDGTDHGATEFTIDGYPGPDALAVDRLPALRAGVADLQARVANLGFELHTGIPGVLDRIDAGRTAAHRIVPVLAVCLVLLACLTIFLAVGYGTEGRRPELAVVALRGARFGQRWWLATGENLVAIVVGAIAGCLTGQLLVNAFTAVRFPGVGADPGLSSLRWAPLATAAALLTAVLAERRQLATPVADLLRQARAGHGGARAIAAEAVVVLLAVVAAAQLSVSHGALTGVGLFATALVLLAAALVVARVLARWATAYSRRALRRGRIGAALAGFQISRRPAATRLLALLVAAVAVTGYAACAVNVAARQRSVQAGLGLGAARVLTAGPVGRQALLAAVRRADPGGGYAMAAVPLPRPPGQAPVLAVDSSRLAAVADWPASGPGSTTVGRALRPATADPVTITGGTVSFDITSSGFRTGKSVELRVVLSPLTTVRADAAQEADGTVDDVARLGVLQPGRHTYTQTVPACTGGCVLNAVQLRGGEAVQDVAGRVTLHGFGGTAAAHPALPGARWQTTQGGRAEVAPDGVRIDIASLNGLVDGLFALPTDAPNPLPAAVAGSSGPAVLGFDGRRLPVVAVAHVPVLPGVGAPAALVDLDYADRLATDGTRTLNGQVWLSRRTPPEVLQRLRDSGLTFADDVRADQLRAGLDAQGPALAVLFYVLVAALAVLLAAGALVLAAAVDRAHRVADLSALRGQGLSPAALRQATLWTYPVSVGAAVLAGMGIALLGWRVTGWALPLAGVHPPSFPLPGSPDPLVLAETGGAVFVVLAGVAYLTGRRTLAEIA